MTIFLFVFGDHPLPTNADTVEIVAKKHAYAYIMPLIYLSYIRYTAIGSKEEKNKNLTIIKFALILEFTAIAAIGVVIFE
jgi:hypothetical protein